MAFDIKFCNLKFVSDLGDERKCDHNMTPSIYLNLTKLHYLGSIYPKTDPNGSPLESLDRRKRSLKYHCTPDRKIRPVPSKRNGAAMNRIENDPAGGGCDNAGNDELEEFSDEFKCCVCLDLIYKPVVLACGHISCFWCVFEAMDYWHESHCPVCRHSYNHFPTICWLLHSVLLKLYPKDYQRRERQVSADEKTNGTSSPQFENPTNPTISNDKTTKNVAVGDLLCTVCKQLIYRPVVLNCGHVFCETCIVDSCDGPCRCPMCQSMHPNGFPKVCLVLEGFLEQNVPEEYCVRKTAVNNRKGVTIPGSTQVPEGGQCSSVSIEEYLSNPGRTKVHFGIGCDFCGMYPLVGDRYKCEDCLENVGLDVCENCYKNSSNLSGRFNQQHKPDHKFKIVEPRPIIFLSSEFPEEDHTHVSQEDQTDDDSSHNSHQDLEGGEDIGPTS
ncbi:hypothetical protein LXL04_033262 [Taraxacum kok-saghyz]